MLKQHENAMAKKNFFLIINEIFLRELIIKNLPKYAYKE